MLKMIRNSQHGHIMYPIFTKTFSIRELMGIHHILKFEPPGSKTLACRAPTDEDADADADADANGYTKSDHGFPG